MATGSATYANPEVSDLDQVPDFSLLGKKAFVTGSSRGIGRAVAMALAHAGADVAISCNTGGAAADEVCHAIRDLGRKASYYAHNVALESEIESMCNEVKRDFGTIDILVNNAAINRDRSFKKLTKDAWDEVITTDLTSVFLVTKHFIDEMADRGWGRIINMSSMSGEIGNFGQANYAAAKAGMIGLTKTLAREYARKGVTVNAVAPGFTKTRMTEGIPDKAMEAGPGGDPAGTHGRPCRDCRRRRLPGVAVGGFRHRRRARYQRGIRDVKRKGDAPWPIRSKKSRSTSRNSGSTRR